MASSPRRKPVSLDQLGALCDEMAALVRAGVPLEQGLSGAAEELQGTIGRVGGDLAARLERGEDLASAMRSSDQRFPEYFSAMVEAGIRSGQLSIALEGMVATAKRVMQLRRDVILALIPTVVTLLVAYTLFFVIVAAVVTRIGWFYQQLGQEQDRWSRWSASVATMPWPLQVLLPLLMLVVIVVWMRRSRGSQVMQSDGAGRSLWWLRPARHILARGRLCAFCDILALLVEQEVPAGEAVRLAAAASGDKHLQQAGGQLAGAIERGETSPAAIGLPPMLRWFLLGSANLPGKSSRSIAIGLRRIAEGYRYELLIKTEILRVYLPTAATIFVGGTVCVVYGLIALWPWWKLLYHMSESPGMVI